MNYNKIVSFFILFCAVGGVNLKDVFAATPYRGFIVKLKSTAKIESLFNSQNHISGTTQVNQVVQTSFGNFIQVNSNLDLMTLQNSLSTNEKSNIEYIVPNYLIHVKLNNPEDQVAAPKDARFKDQWGLNNTGANGGNPESASVPGADINALKAWSITKGNQKNVIKVAVIDTGVDYNHNDLKAQMDVNEAELNGQPEVDDDNNGFVDDIYGYNFAKNTGDPMDGAGHGTHCAGVIGAAHDNQGTVGVMAHVKILALKFLDDDGNGEEINAIKAIDYGIKRGVKVMSNSWGGEGRDQALEDAIKAANDAGITFVAAAGNDAANNDTASSFPANYKVDNVISVGSFNSAGKISDFSNYGINSVHVLAPGSSIVSTVPGNQYESMSGTSMATPHVAGIVGLMLSIEPDLTPLQIRDRLIATSRKSSDLSRFSLSGGRVDAYNALRNVSN